jgi:hypothetical protein
MTILEILILLLIAGTGVLAQTIAGLLARRPDCRHRVGFVGLLGTWMARNLDCWSC